MQKEIKQILIVLNSIGNTLGKYPIGNKILTEKTKNLESKGMIKFDNINNLWLKGN